MSKNTPLPAPGSKQQDWQIAGFNLPMNRAFWLVGGVLILAAIAGYFVSDRYYSNRMTGMDGSQMSQPAEMPMTRAPDGSADNGSAVQPSGPASNKVSQPPASTSQ
jgi:hypothetical protein